MTDEFISVTTLVPKKFIKEIKTTYVSIETLASMDCINDCRLCEVLFPLKVINCVSRNGERWKNDD